MANGFKFSPKCEGNACCEDAAVNCTLHAVDLDQPDGTDLGEGWEELYGDWTMNGDLIRCTTADSVAWYTVPVDEIPVPDRWRFFKCRIIGDDGDEFRLIFTGYPATSDESECVQFTIGTPGKISIRSADPFDSTIKVVQEYPYTLGDNVWHDILVGCAIVAPDYGSTNSAVRFCVYYGLGEDLICNFAFDSLISATSLAFALGTGANTGDMYFDNPMMLYGAIEKVGCKQSGPCYWFLDDNPEDFVTVIVEDAEDWTDPEDPTRFVQFSRLDGTYVLDLIVVEGSHDCAYEFVFDPPLVLNDLAPEDGEAIKFSTHFNTGTGFTLGVFCTAFGFLNWSRLWYPDQFDGYVYDVTAGSVNPISLPFVPDVIYTDIVLGTASLEY